MVKAVCKGTVFGLVELKNVVGKAAQIEGHTDGLDNGLSE